MVHNVRKLFCLSLSGPQDFIYFSLDYIYLYVKGNRSKFTTPTFREFKPLRKQPRKCVPFTDTTKYLRKKG